ncbi:MAG: hypothetical protein NTW04_02845, partial [Elusimicrobia bacterium]|nr:hypothetical protein [Elusimicrobiota bacterium]
MLYISPQLGHMLSSGNPVYFKQVLLSVRNWNGSAYIYGEPQDITNDVVEISPIKWKLDREAYGVWTTPVCNIVLRNDKNQWLLQNPSGFFPDGAVIRKSKVQIKAGAIMPGGEKSSGYVFTGYINSELRYKPHEKTVTVNIAGRMSLFEDFSAESVSNFSADELLGSNSGTEFSTAALGVGAVTEVKRGATPGGASSAQILTPENDYTISDINVKGAPAKITIKQAL